MDEPVKDTAVEGADGLMSRLEDAELAAEMQERYKDAKDSSSLWREEAEEDFSFRDGHQWDDADIDKLNREGRPVITFNRVGTIISAVLGIEANQRQSTTYLPREVNDTKVSEGLTATARWVQDYGDYDSEEAQAFENMVTCGMGWTETRMEYDTDLDGKVVRESIDPLEMYWDPCSRKRNLTDRRWQIRAKKMSIEEIEELWPDAELVSSEEGGNEHDGKVTFVNPEERYSENSIGGGEEEDGYTVLHYQWYELTPVWRVADPTSGKMVEMDDAKFEAAKPILDMGGAKYLRQKKRVYYQAFSCGMDILERGPCPAQTGFTFRCVTGKHDHVGKQWYGLVRVMKDPQRWSNKFFSQVLDILNSNAKGGLLAEEGAFNNPKKAEEDWSKTDSIIYMKPGAITGNKVMLKPIPPYPQGFDRMMMFAITSIREVVGINLEVLGLADREQAGVLEETRKKSAYTILATLFDSLRAYRKDAGILLLEFIQKYVPVDRIASVLEPEMKPVAEAIKSLDIRKIDISVAEAPESENNKMVTWSFIQQIAPVFLKMGMPIPPDILKYSPLPAPLADKWAQMLEQSRNNPQAKMMKQLEMKEKTTDIDNTVADTELTRAKTAHEKVDAMKTMMEPVVKPMQNPQRRPAIPQSSMR